MADLSLNWHRVLHMVAVTQCLLLPDSAYLRYLRYLVHPLSFPIDHLSVPSFSCSILSFQPPRSPVATVSYFLSHPSSVLSCNSISCASSLPMLRVPSLAFLATMFQLLTATKAIQARNVPTCTTSYLVNADIQPPPTSTVYSNTHTQTVRSDM